MIWLATLLARLLRWRRRRRCSIRRAAWSSWFEAAGDGDLDAICIACDAAERLAHALGQRIQAVVSIEDAA